MLVSYRSLARHTSIMRGFGFYHTAPRRYLDSRNALFHSDILFADIIRYD